MVISEPKSAHLREVLLFAFNWKKSATEAHRRLEEVHGDHALSKSQCYRWFKKFQSGDFELDNEPRGKPHLKFEDAEQQALLDEDSTQTQEKLAKQLQVSQGAVSLRLNSLRMTQKLSRWVPHELSERQQERRLHDNAPAHNATVVKNTIKDLGWELLPHPPYSPDLAPSDYHLFTSLGHALKKQKFSNSDILRKWLVDWVVNGIGKKREAESNGQKFQVDRPRPVRTPATVSKVKRLATTENPPSQRQLSRMCGTSLKTINNIIHKDLELDTRRKGKVHKLTTFHMKNRATNARKLYEEHLAGSRSEYTATLDEAWMYVTYCNGIRKICYIKRGNQVPDNWVHQCSETFPKGFMVVGVMTGRGVLPLIKVPSKVKVNSEFYIECVLKPVIEQLKDLYPGEMDKVFLHHDKASSHTSNKTQQFLQEMKDTLGLNFIRNSDIPVKSPDASPLDFYGFGMLKQRLFNRRPKTEAGLWKAAQEEWSNVSLSKVKEVFAAWKVRCREIAKKKGKHIEHMKKIHVRKIKF
ncbi:hypothetical protein LAZ67_18000762 [Cordylochernes scorpioides]|uniref:Mos1 transposase HTH domain-containing protein n=1 Tax=Cordylochernes scorpioides TaxID=51811 RepID=A0ABY6LF45_9ARAC|nr:hypothetical protein LAZ67_18000762 [Cordylochernes scorpioides]